MVSVINSNLDRAEIDLDQLAPSGAYCHPGAGVETA